MPAEAGGDLGAGGGADGGAFFEEASFVAGPLLCSSLCDLAGSDLEASLAADLELLAEASFFDFSLLLAFSFLPFAMLKDGSCCCQVKEKVK